MSWLPIDTFYFDDPSKRLFWFFLLSSGLLGYLVTLLRGTRKGFSTKSDRLFLSWKYWSHRSSQLDVKLFLLNSLLRGFLLPLEAYLVFHGVKVVHSNFDMSNIQVGGEFSSSFWGLLLYSVFAFVIDDGFRFGQHVLMHKCPWLWQFHKVHHSAPFLTPFTLYRAHWIELFVASGRRVLSLGITTLLFLWMTHGLVQGLDILGVNVFGFLFNLAGANLRHSHIPLSFGCLERILISPAQHQIHHSRSLEHHNKNFGVALAFWDQCYGSWVRGNLRQSLKFGLLYPDRNHKFTLKSVLIDPFQNSRTKIKLADKKEQFLKPEIQKERRQHEIKREKCNEEKYAGDDSSVFTTDISAGFCDSVRL